MAGVGGQEHRGAGDAVGHALHALEELAQRQGAFAQFGRRRSARPRRHVVMVK